MKYARVRFRSQLRYLIAFLQRLTLPLSYAPIRPNLMSDASGVITANQPTDRTRGKAFGHAVMEGMMALSQGGRGPTERGFAIDFLIVVTL